MSSSQFYHPISNEKVLLEPLTFAHIQELKKVCSDSEIWKFFSADLFNPDAMEKWMTDRLNQSKAETQMTYAITLKDEKKVIGSSSYGRIDWKEKVIEIGWTWIGADYIGKGINKHMKIVMLSHAFEVMGIERLELRTDENNVRSRKAMVKIGAQHDGTLRSDRFKPDGTRRSSVVYSILKEEWPGIKATVFKELT